jgi:tetratricopeptide (TPR) repeat protein
MDEKNGSRHQPMSETSRSMSGVAGPLQQAIALYQAGQWDAAESLCTQIRRSDPQQHGAIRLLAVIAAQTQRAPEALELFERLVAVRPDDPQAHLNYANVLRLLGRYDEALGSYEHALRLKPDYVDAHRNLGIVQQDLGRLEEALRSHERALQLKPNYTEAHISRGTVLQQLRHFEQALQSYRAALQQKPDDAFVHINVGSALEDLGRLEEALQSYERALQLKPDLVEAHVNRGSALQQLGRPEEALRSYECALQLKPDAAEVHSNRGHTLESLGRFDEALQSYEHALRLKPDMAETHSNRGSTLQSLGRTDEALQSFNLAIEMRPHLAPLYLNRAYAALLAGDFANGWLDHEWRWQARPDLQDPRFPERTRWLGREPLSGKTIVLHGEQGLGDTLQFCRYVRQVAALGATVILEVPRELSSLLANLDGLSKVVARGEPLPPFDYHSALMSLPLAFQTSLSTIPAQTPYIVSDSTKKRFWQGKLGLWTKPRVGVVWSGGFRANQPELWALHQRRNVPLATLTALQSESIAFYSLQKGEPAGSELRELRAAGWRGLELIDYTESLRDFSDTAALIENLDLVISVDTSTAHLAGALAKPVWIMNRFDTCWRWLLHRDDSPWYPTARLYRQQRAGDWDAVVERIRIELSRTPFDRTNR